MKNLLIRNVPEELIEKLKKRAKKHRRSLQQELLNILVEQTDETAEEILKKITARTKKWDQEKRQFTDSVLLVREDRNR
jgi:plasmid stability protein